MAVQCLGWRILVEASFAARSLEGGKIVPAVP